MNTIYLFGALRVVIEDQTGAVLGVFDCATHQSADSLYSQAYINTTCTRARLAWQATADH